MQRVFVVGCPRSGTTLVQAMLARHPDVFSLPETYFFEALLGDSLVRWRDREARPTRKWYHRAGLAQSWGRRRLRQLERLQAVRRQRLVPRRWNTCVRRYVELLDESATRRGCLHWVEKTPNHLLYLDEIRSCIPDARVVHVLRRGIDVVASVVDADLKVSSAAFRGGIVRWTRRWNRAMEMHMALLGNPGHHLLCLEDLIDDPDQEWLRLQRFLGLDHGKPLASGPQPSIADIRTEPWKAAAITGTARRTRSKAEELFGPRSLAWLRQRLTDYRPIQEAVRDASGTASRLPKSPGATVRPGKIARA